MSPLFLLSIQMLVGAVILGGASLLTGTFMAEIGPVVSSTDTLALIVFSTIVFTLGSFLIAVSVKEGNAFMAGTIEISYPLFILAFTLLLGWSEPVSPCVLIGVLAILTGAVIIKTA